MHGFEVVLHMLHACISRVTLRDLTGPEMSVSLGGGQTYLRQSHAGTQEIGQMHMCLGDVD